MDITNILPDELKHADGCQFIKIKKGLQSACGNKRQKVLPYCKIHGPMVKGSPEMLKQQVELWSQQNKKEPDVVDINQEESDILDSNVTSSTDSEPTPVKELKPVHKPLSIKEKRLLDQLDDMPEYDSGDEKITKKSKKTSKKKEKLQISTGSKSDSEAEEASPRDGSSNNKTSHHPSDHVKNFLVAGTLIFSQILEQIVSKNVFDVEGTTNLLSQSPEFPNAIMEIFEDMMPVETLEMLETPYAKLASCVLVAVKSAREIKSCGFDPKTYGKELPPGLAQSPQPVVNDPPEQAIPTPEFIPAVPGQKQDFK